MARNIFTTQLLTQPLVAQRVRRWRTLVQAARWRAQVGARWASDHAIELFCLLLLLLISIGAISAARSSVQAAPTATALPAIILIATPTALPPPPTAAPRAIEGRWDYANPQSAVSLTDGDIVRIIGRAEDWRLIETTAGAQVWIAAADVPIVGVASEQPLPDLAPSPTPIVIIVHVPAPVPAGSIDVPGARIQTITTPDCWAGPPAVYEPGMERCWQGVPFRQP